MNKITAFPVLGASGSSGLSDIVRNRVPQLPHSSLGDSSCQE